MITKELEFNKRDTIFLSDRNGSHRYLMHRLIIQQVANFYINLTSSTFGIYYYVIYGIK
jgi:hypothetical protein